MALPILVPAPLPGLPGSTTIPVPIPNDAALVGGSSVTDGQVFAQCVFLDAGAPCGLAATPGLAVTVL
ncbi:MAG: hypothetical protein L0323_16785 [Planctomycetes bacterium]|nr:hypothetical protein [Planctomycetota bacterium]